MHWDPNAWYILLVVGFVTWSYFHRWDNSSISNAILVPFFQFVLLAVIWERWSISKRRQTKYNWRKLPKTLKITNIIDYLSQMTVEKNSWEKGARKWHRRYYDCPTEENNIKLRLRTSKEYVKYQNSDAFKDFLNVQKNLHWIFFRALAMHHYSGSAVVHVVGKIFTENEFKLV